MRNFSKCPVLLHFECRWAARGGFVSIDFTHTSAGNSHFLFGVPRGFQLGATLFYLPCPARYVGDVTVVRHIVTSRRASTLRTAHTNTHTSPCGASQQTLDRETWPSVVLTFVLRGSSDAMPGLPELHSILQSHAGTCLCGVWDRPLLRVKGETPADLSMSTCAVFDV